MIPVGNLILVLKQAQAFPGLTLIPVYNKANYYHENILLGDAVAKEQVTVKEMANSRVQALEVTSTQSNVICVKGTLLEGGGQDRQVVRSCILAKGTSQIPVQCVQHGRWNPQGQKTFSSAKTMTTSYMRHGKQDQTQTWNTINSYESSTTRSATESLRCTMSITLDSKKLMSETVTTHRVQVNETTQNTRSKARNIKEKINPVRPGQVGIFAIRFAGSENQQPKFLLEAVANPVLWEQMHHSVVDSLIYDAAISHSDKKPVIDVRKVAAFLKDLQKGKWQKAPAVGIEDGWELTQSSLRGEAICHKHLPIPVHIMASENCI
ncbi:ARPP-1 family domain-containing protein [Candidatus Uabimicrobium amorphum]|uniref:ARG and Rhodanese-Phosphatase-superfamily-associated domain-containing protein n=1 Tax=Uabimicrobium amorphum TaxID=2596890 RepID=A0A5S9F590_UABAM|nr:DUF6569 family protein [Candidatus Uabimicrobium amorphum]BBM86586.1 hypothetical protein UABAM_04972 [Candidatus Uabimicrobium amorphum]